MKERDDEDRARALEQREDARRERVERRQRDRAEDLYDGLHERPERWVY